MSDPEAIDPRLAEARRLLERHGLAGGTVRVEGHQREIAVVRVPAGGWDAVARGEHAGLVGGLKALGFRYVSLDLETGSAT